MTHRVHDPGFGRRRAHGPRQHPRACLRKEHPRGAYPSRPADVHQPGLRELAAIAERIDRLEAAAEALGGPDRPDEGLDDLLDLVLIRLEDEDAILAVALAEWLAADPEHAHILRLEAFLPWRGQDGWDRAAPHWARILATHAELACPGLAAPVGPGEPLVFP